MQGNNVYSSGNDGGIFIHSASNNTVLWNNIYANASSAFPVYPFGGNNLFISNTIYQNYPYSGFQSIGIENAQTLIGNVVYANSGGGIGLTSERKCRGGRRSWV